MSLLNSVGTYFSTFPETLPNEVPMKNFMKFGESTEISSLMFGKIFAYG